MAARAWEYAARGVGRKRGQKSCLLMYLRIIKENFIVLAGGRFVVEIVYSIYKSWVRLYRYVV